MAKKIDAPELETIARGFLTRSMGAPDSEVGVLRDRNLRAYNAQPVMEFAPPEIEDRSQYVSQDVAQVVDGMLPQLLDVFVSDEAALTCEPTKPDLPPSPLHPQGMSYSDQADSATKYLNYLFYKKNDGLQTLYDWIHDACLQKVGFVKIWAEEEEHEEFQQFTGLLPEQVQMLANDDWELDEPKEAPDGTVSVDGRKRGTRMAYRVEVVPPHEMRIDPNARWGGKPWAIGHVCNKPRFELEQLGIDMDNVGAIGSSVTDIQYNVEANDMLGEVQGDIYTQEIHESHTLYEYAELYLMLDVDGDGIAEWNQVCMVNAQMVSHQHVDDHPFAEMCLMPRPHAYFGDCPADRAYDIQLERTNLKRAVLDNTYLSVNGRTYVNEDAGVNIDDLLDNRPGGIVRGRGAANQAVAPLGSPSLPEGAEQASQWLEDDLENRTGFTRYSQGLDSDSLNKTATGINIITQKSDMRLRLMSRFAAAAIKVMFRKLLKLVTQYQKTQEWIKVADNFIPINPDEWKDQFNITINVGLGHGTKQQQAQRVMSMMPLQMQGLQLGIVTPEQVANTIRLYATLNEFKNPQEFVMPEGQQPGQPVPPMKALQAQLQQMGQQLQALHGQLQQTQQENFMLKVKESARQGDLAIKQQKVQIDAQEAGANIAHKAHSAQLDSAKAQHEAAAATLDNIQSAHQVGMNMGLAQAELDWQQLQQAASQIASGAQQ
jgi:hypothetical protein